MFLLAFAAILALLIIGGKRLIALALLFMVVTWLI